MADDAKKNVTAEEFQAAVLSAIDSGMTVKDLQQDVAVTRVTLDRWSKGQSLPIPGVRNVVLGFIKDRTPNNPS